MDVTNMYMMTLALEYKILSRNYQDTKETVKELFHLLYAINRLDMEAEQFWDTPPTNDNIQPNGPYNGFMLREDIPYNYFRKNNNENLLHFNYSLLENNYPNTSNPINSYTGFTGLQFTDSLTNDNPFSGYFTGHEPKHKMPLSQDKYHSMLVALMFIDKYLPSSVDYNGEAFQDGFVSLRDEAKEIAKRVYSYCNGVNNAWKLRYLDRLGFSHGNLANSVGGDAWPYSFALSRMTCHTTSSFPWSSYFVTGCSNYTDPVAQTFGYVEYSTQASSPAVTMDAAVFKTWDAAGANALAQIGTQPIPVPAFLFMQNNTGTWSIEWSELLRKVLHQDGVLLRQLSIYGDPINVAPCQGPYNYGSCNHGGWEWSSQDRLEHPNSRGGKCGNPNGFLANFPGVDYMLLHNLYYEYQNQVLDGNNGNATNNVASNVSTWIYNAATTVGSVVSSAGCSIVNGLSGFFGGSSTLCDPTIQPSGNGGSGSNNVSLPGYRGAYNYMDNRDENIWPRFIVTGLPIQGTASTPGKVAVFQNLTSIAHIYASSSPAAPNNTIPADVTYRAGKEIDLQPGFTVDAGSTFHAYIQRYLCNGNNSNPLYMRHSAADSSGTVSDSLLRLELLALDYENDYINPVPIHYIVSPTSDSDNNPTVPDTYMEDEDLTGYAKLNDFDITPNPSSGLLKIKTRKMQDDEVLSAHVYDMKGQLIISYDNITTEKEINLQGYSAGIYMIQVISNTGRSMTKKIDITD